MSKKIHRRGYRKYRCDECKEESFHHWIERNRAARLRCPGCGSARMELVSAEGKEESARLQDNRYEGSRSMTPAPARPNRRVT